MEKEKERNMQPHHTNTACIKPGIYIRAKINFDQEKQTCTRNTPNVKWKTSLNRKNLKPIIHIIGDFLFLLL